MYLVKLISKKRNYFSIGKDYTNSLSIVIHNDTLFSAICNNFRKIYGNDALEAFLNQITESQSQSESKFEISSCFHYIDIYKEGKLLNTIYFIPRPLIRFPLNEKSQKYLDENPKVFKKVKFVSFEVLRKLQQNVQISLSQYHIIDNNYLVDDKDLKNLGLIKFLKLLDESDAKLEKSVRAIRRKISIFEMLDEQKVRISRTSVQSEPFTWSKFKFRSSKYFVRDGEKEINFELIPGFFFLFDYSGLDNDLIKRIKTSIKLIIDEGLGGKRSIGCGLVDDIKIVELDENFQYFDLLEVKPDGFLVNISLVYPSLEEIQNVIYFNIYGRSGFVFSADNNSKRFNDVKFIEEGAIFEKKVGGKLVQVASDDFISKFHKIYKNGIGFYLNIGKIEVDYKR